MEQPKIPNQIANNIVDTEALSLKIDRAKFAKFQEEASQQLPFFGEFENTGDTYTSIKINSTNIQGIPDSVLIYDKKDENYTLIEDGEEIQSDSLEDLKAQRDIAVNRRIQDRFENYVIIRMDPNSVEFVNPNTQDKLIYHRKSDLYSFNGSDKVIVEEENSIDNLINKINQLRKTTPENIEEILRGQINSTNNLQ